MQVLTTLWGRGGVAAPVPGAVAGASHSGAPGQPGTAAERRERGALVALVCACDTDDDRAGALMLAQADPASALIYYRTIVRAFAAGADARRVSRTLWSQGRQ